MDCYRICRYTERLPATTPDTARTVLPGPERFSAAATNTAWTVNFCCQRFATTTPDTAGTVSRRLEWFAASSTDPARTVLRLRPDQLTLATNRADEFVKAPQFPVHAYRELRGLILRVPLYF